MPATSDDQRQQAGGDQRARPNRVEVDPGAAQESRGRPIRRPRSRSCPSRSASRTYARSTTAAPCATRARHRAIGEHRAMMVHHHDASPPAGMSIRIGNSIRPAPCAEAIRNDHSASSCRLDAHRDPSRMRARPDQAKDAEQRSATRRRPERSSRRWRRRNRARRSTRPPRQSKPDGRARSAPAPQRPWRGCAPAAPAPPRTAIPSTGRGRGRRRAPRPRSTARRAVTDSSTNQTRQSPPSRRI